MKPHDDFAIEPIRGLPERLPPNERILWQGEPAWTALARRVFHTRKIAIYFGLLAAWRLIANLYDGETVMTALSAMTLMLAIGAAAVGLFALFAWLTARTTVYTITNRRLVLRVGIALPITINLPFRSVKSASLKHHADGTGDVSLTLVDGQRLAYLVLWPHARPWRMGRPQPSLRSVPDAEGVARTLADALAASVAERSPATVAAPRTKPSQAKPDPDAAKPETPPQHANVAA